MASTEKLSRELPLHNRTVIAGGHAWTIEVVSLKDGAPINTVRTAELIIRGPMTHALTLRIPGEVLVVEHMEGDVEWLIETIQRWLSAPDPKGDRNIVTIGR